MHISTCISAYNRCIKHVYCCIHVLQIPATTFPAVSAGFLSMLYILSGVGWLGKSVLSLYGSTRRFKESEWGPWGLENSFHMQSNKQKRISTLNDKLIASILNKTGIKMNYLEIWIRGGDKWFQKHIQMRLKIKQEFATSKEMAVTWILGHTLPPILSIVSNTKCEASWDMTS